MIAKALVCNGAKVYIVSRKIETLEKGLSLLLLLFLIVLIPMISSITTHTCLCLKQLHRA